MTLRLAIDDFASDPDAAQKLGIGALVTAVPLLSIAAIGYEVRLARQIAWGAGRTLPEWGDPGTFLLEGLGLTLARLVYGLPLSVVMLAGVFIWLPLLLALEGERVTPEQQSAIAAGLLLVCGGTVALGLIYALAYSLLAPAVTAQYVRHGRFAACFDPPAMARFVRRDPANYLRAWATLLGVGMLASLAGIVVSSLLRFIPCFGSLLNLGAWGWLRFMLMLLSGHLVGQLIRADNAGPAVPD